MYYEINVSLNGMHLFATNERSITTETEARRVYKLFKNKFPESEGYKVSITYWKKTGYDVSFEED